MGVRERILARRDLDGSRAARDITTLASALNAEGVKSVQSRFVTARTILAECLDGVGILDALDAAKDNRAVGWALQFLGQDSGLDVGEPVTQAMIEQLASVGVLTPDQGAQLKSLALQPLTVTQEQVALDMYNPDGSEK